MVVEAKNLTKAFGDKLLIDDLTFSLPRGGIVGVIGPNGAGKTTLFKMITGAEQPDGGALTVGSTVQIAHVDQSRETLDPNKTVFEEISDGLDHMVVGGREYPQPRLGRELRLHRQRPAEGGRRRCRAANATACNSPRCCAPAAT